ncbi:MAG: GNAT family N-acetyltransferase [Lachnospiraceae bacterium]|nr:GNAT family N-acetyltransferase [Lachnospiraceae bacterium]
MNYNLETDRLNLTCLTKASALLVHAFYEENATYFDPYELTRPDQFYTVAFQTAVLEWEWKEMQAGRCLRYYIFLKSEPTTIIGTVNLSNIRMGKLRNASIGYKIDHRFRNQGYATEACKCLLEYAYKELHFHRIVAEIIPLNMPSIRVVKSLGFIQEGVEREAAEINGKWQDLLLFAKLNPYVNSVIQ